MELVGEIERLLVWVLASLAISANWIEIYCLTVGQLSNFVLTSLYMCTLFPTHTGTSPLTGLTPGLHRLRIVPQGCSANRGVTFRFYA